MDPNARPVAPPSDDDRVTYFAATHTRGQHRAFGIRAKDREKHMYVIGKTGMGKSTMLENMAIQDLQNGEGMCFIDPHGSTAEKLLDFVPQHRVDDVLYFAPFDSDFPIGFNVMEDVGYDKRHLVVSGLMGTFKRIWADAWSARMEYILENTLLALLEYPDSTLLDVNRMLVNKSFRQDVVTHITDPIVRSFWTEEFATYTDRYTQEATPAIQNKIGQFTSNPLIRNILGQANSSFDMRRIMDEKKIMIVNLSKGRMGEKNASLLGSMLVVKIYLAAMSRADAPARTIFPRFFFYVDEFQSVVNDAFADILSEARKYKLCLTIAHQYIEQMEENVRNAVFGNVGTTVTFRVGPFDAEVLKTVFEPTFYPEDMVNLGIGSIYLTLMIDGVGSAPFSAQTLPPIEDPQVSFSGRIISRSREQFAAPRASIEASVDARMQNFSGSAAAQGDPGAGKGGNDNGGNSRTRQDRPSYNGGNTSDRGPRSRPDQSRAPAQQSPSATPQRDRDHDRRPPRPTRPPAEVLREQLSKKKDEPKAEPRPEKKAEEVHRNALRDALAKATGGSDSAVPAADTQKSPSPAQSKKDPHERPSQWPPPSSGGGGEKPVERPQAAPRPSIGASQQSEEAPRERQQQGALKQNQNGEISPEELRRVLNG